MLQHDLHLNLKSQLHAILSSELFPLFDKNIYKSALASISKIGRGSGNEAEKLQNKSNHLSRYF